MLFTKCPHVQPPPPRPPGRAHTTSSSTYCPCAHPEAPEDQCAPLLPSFIKFHRKVTAGRRALHAAREFKADTRRTRAPSGPPRAGGDPGAPVPAAPGSVPGLGTSIWVFSFPHCAREVWGGKGAISISPPGTEGAFLPCGAQLGDGVGDQGEPAPASPGPQRPRLTQQRLQEDLSPQGAHGRGAF